MKISIKVSIFILLLTGFQHCFADFPFVKQRLMCDFKGIAYNQKSLLCYGTGAVVLRSDDKGDHWQQIYVADDKYTVKKIIFAQGAYFGILDSNYIISSFDEGNTWKLNLNEDSKAIIDFDFDGSKYFFLKNDRIAVYNDPSDKSYEILIDSSLHPKIIRVINDNIYLGCDSNKIIIQDKSGNGNSVIVHLNKFTNRPLKSAIAQIELSLGNIYVRTDDEVFKSSDEGVIWAKDVDYASIIKLHNDKMYDVYTYRSDKNNISYLVFSGISLGKIIPINMQTITRYVSSQKYTDFKFISDDTVIAVGNDKLINMSYDGGKTWQFKCNLRSVNYCINKWLNDSLGFLYTDHYQISKTTNSGVTWLPQNYNYVPKGELEVDSPETWYIDTSGVIILYSRPRWTNADNLIFSTDFGENYTTVCDTMLNIYLKDINHPTIIKNDKTYLVFLCVDLKNYVCTIKAELDENMQLMNKVSLDSILIIKAKIINNNNELMGIGIEKGYPNFNKGYDSVAFYLMYSYDWGLTWEKHLKFNINNIAINQIEEIKNLLLFSSSIPDSINPKKYVTSVDIVDYQNEIFYPRVYCDSLSIYDLMYLNNILYGFSSVDKYIQNNNFFQNFSDWQIKSFDSINFIAANYSNNKIAYGVIVDQKYNRFLYKFIPKGTEGVEEQTEIKQPYFYAMYPYPLPGRNMISCHIFTSMDFDPANPDVKVYDLNGEMVSGGSAIEMTRTSGWEWDIKWNCTGLNDGIYVIALKDGDAIKTIRVMVAR